MHKRKYEENIAIKMQDIDRLTKINEQNIEHNVVIHKLMQTDI